MTSSSTSPLTELLDSRRDSSVGGQHAHNERERRRRPALGFGHGGHLHVNKRETKVEHSESRYLTSSTLISWASTVVLGGTMQRVRQTIKPVALSPAALLLFLYLFLSHHIKSSRTWLRVGVVLRLGHARRQPVSGSVEVVGQEQIAVPHRHVRPPAPTQVCFNDSPLTK